MIFAHVASKLLPFWEVGPLAALLALRWPHMRSGAPVGLHLEASWRPFRREGTAHRQNLYTQTLIHRMHAAGAGIK